MVVLPLPDTVIATVRIRERGTHIEDDRLVHTTDALVLHQDGGVTTTTITSEPDVDAAEAGHHTRHGATTEVMNATAATGIMVIFVLGLGQTNRMMPSMTVEATPILIDYHPDVLHPIANDGTVEVLIAHTHNSPNGLVPVRHHDRRQDHLGRPRTIERLDWQLCNPTRHLCLLNARSTSPACLSRRRLNAKRRNVHEPNPRAWATSLALNRKRSSVALEAWKTGSDAAEAKCESMQTRFLFI